MASETPIPGVNDLLSTYPEIAKLWSDKNEFGPESVTMSSGKTVWWTCEKDHPDYDMKISSKTYMNAGCPYCANRRIHPGFNDLLTEHPEIAAEWSAENDKGPHEVSSKSGYMAKWVCSMGHTNTSRVVEKVGGILCAVCSGKKIQKGVNDLETLRPDLVSQISPRNTKDYSALSPHSKEHLLWICEKGHEWSAPLSSRNAGGGCSMCLGKVPIPGETDLKTLRPGLISEWADDRLMSEFTLHSGYKASWMCSYGHRWVTSINDRTTYKTGCPTCYKPSQSQILIADFIKEFYEVEENTRKVITPLELDIYIPEKKLAVEFNGIYWHTEDQGKDRYYHYNKWKMCHDKGIQLITVWEDDWLYNRPLVERMLKHKLGVSDEPRVYARKCSVVVLDYSRSSAFLEENHIQGQSTGSTYLGLVDGDDLVAVSVFTKTSSGVELKRYATNRVVVGGHSKLLKVARNMYPTEVFHTFADLCVSDGGLYEDTGWTTDRFLKPDYKYLYKGRRVHKFNFRLKRFKNDPELVWDETMSEKQLAVLNGIPRIWDCGKIRYTLEPLQ